MKRLLVLLGLALCLAGCGSKEEAEWTAFVYEGTAVSMHAPAGDILTVLGEPKSYTETPSCAFEGLDKTYYFGSFYLSTYPGKGGDRVSGLWFADDSVATPEGIAIGSHREAVEEAYGTEAFNGENAWYLTREDCKLTIILIGDKVGSVQYEALFS